MLGDNTLENTILKQLFLQRLPTNVQLISASTKEAVDIEQLADLADKIIEVSSPLFSTMHTGALSKPQKQLAPQPDQVCALSTSVENVTRHVQALTTQPQVERERSRSRGRVLSGSRSRGHNPSSRAHEHAGQVCWYHWKHGEKAHKCISPCSYQSRPSELENSNTSDWRRRVILAVTHPVAYST